MAPLGAVLDLVLGALACPVCAQPLAMSDAAPSALACPARHTFNLARAGYASLTPGGGPSHRADTPAMVKARADFLASGHYRPIAGAVAESVAAALAEGVGTAPSDSEATPAAKSLNTGPGPARPGSASPGNRSDPAKPASPGGAGPDAGAGPLILDLAGGIGYYLAAVLETVPQARGLVLDLSPAAAKRAARCHPRAAAATADAWGQLPLMDASVNHVISLFGPRGAAELSRVTAPGGGLTVVTPAAGHLAELRAGGWLLGIGGLKTAKLDRQLAGFELGERRDLGYRVELGRGQAADLVMMGPNVFHLARPEVEARLATAAWPAQATVAVTIS
ncbi:MAG: hypothetical protein LBG60_12740, partial [Bifidobacteriaceae bacterium]|nr:hypothetical protein [Bifidobacteriaceae bacterium]